MDNNKSGSESAAETTRRVRSGARSSGGSRVVAGAPSGAGGAGSVAS